LFLILKQQRKCKQEFANGIFPKYILIDLGNNFSNQYNMRKRMIKSFFKTLSFSFAYLFSYLFV